MPDIRDIVAQTSALEKLPRIDQKNQELRAEKQAVGQIEQNIIKQETVEDTKEVGSKIIKEEQEREKEKEQAKGRNLKEKGEEKKERKEIKSSDVVEVEEGKIIDVKV
jgi:hypothetical protein